MSTNVKTKTDDQMDAKSDIKAVIRNLERFFKQADEDRGGGLDMQEFSGAMLTIYPTYTDEELTALHMQIDTNCDGTVDFKELLSFEVGKIIARQKMDLDRRIFTLPIKIVEVGYYNKIVQIIARRIDEEVYSNVSRQPQRYLEEEYVSVTTDGVLNFWTKRFDERTPGSVYTKTEALPFSHKHKVHVHDMVYIKEREEVAVATTERELRFYVWTYSKLEMKYSIITEGGRINTLTYWSNGKKAVFSFADAKGFLYVFVSYDIEEHGLFYHKAFERIRLESYHRVYASSLLKNLSKDYLAVRMQMFDEGCSLIKFIPSIEEFAVCGQSSTKMVLAPLPKSAKDKLVKKQLANASSKKIFTCVEYSIDTQELVTGGTDGILRTWFTYKTDSCKSELIGHSKPMNYLLHNPKLKVFICLHEDRAICIWSLEVRQCLQTINADRMGPNRVSGVYYSSQNNELVLANTKIGIYLGTGTDIFKEMLTSHVKPLCGAIYHSIYKQVVSVCQDGWVTVWDVNTGKTLMQFNVSPYNLVASTAIALNKPLRKLITVSNDGQVRFWNFNNGTELEVLPVTVPTVVTGIICTEDRVFLSGKQSCVIYNLDLAGKEPMYLEHPLMEGGVSSIAMHPTDGKIMTASKNGVVIIWDAETCHALYYINGKESPKIQQIFKKEMMGKTGPLPVEKKTCMVNEYERIPVPTKLLTTKTDVLPQSKVFNSPLLLCLKTREADFNRATLLIAEGCYVCAWSVKVKGGLLAKFKALNKEDVQIISIESDVADHILMIGDSNGYVYVWDLQTYGDRKYDFEGPFEEIGNWKVSVRPPPLLSKWKAHNGPVMSVTCNPSRENFITTGWDCNVHLWRNKRRRVGTFGKDQWESKQLSPDWDSHSKLTEHTGHEGEFEEDVQFKPRPMYSRRWPQKKIQRKPSMLEALKPHDDELNWVKELQSLTLRQQKSEFTKTDIKTKQALAKEEKEKRHHHKVRHFLERKQLLEFPLLYDIKCPQTGPVPTELLPEDVQITLKPTPSRDRKENPHYVPQGVSGIEVDQQNTVKPLLLSDIERYFATRKSEHEDAEEKNEEQAVSEIEDEFELLNESSLSKPRLLSDLHQCQDIYGKKYRKEPDQTKTGSTFAEDDTFEPALPSAERRYCLAMQQKYKGLYEKWQENVSQDPDKQLFQSEDEAQPKKTSGLSSCLLSAVDGSLKLKATSEVQQTQVISQIPTLPPIEPKPRNDESFRAKHVTVIPPSKPRERGTTALPSILGAAPRDSRASLTHRTTFDKPGSSIVSQVPRLPLIAPPPTPTKQETLRAKRFTAIPPSASENRATTALPPVPRDKETSVKPNVAHKTIPAIKPSTKHKKEGSAQHSTVNPQSKPEDLNVPGTPL